MARPLANGSALILGDDPGPIGLSISISPSHATPHVETAGPVSFGTSGKILGMTGSLGANTKEQLQGIADAVAVAIGGQSQCITGVALLCEVAKHYGYD